MFGVLRPVNQYGYLWAIEEEEEEEEEEEGEGEEDNPMIKYTHS